MRDEKGVGMVEGLLEGWKGMEVEWQRCLEVEG
jgi:hypothetical protein